MNKKNDYPHFVKKIYGEIGKSMLEQGSVKEINHEIREVFRTRVLPVPAVLAGYAYAIDKLAINTILPFQLHAIAKTNTNQKTPDCIVHPLAKKPKATLYDNLVFALKYEGINLLILKQVFEKAGAAFVQEAVNAHPTSGYARRICFFYEWLTQNKLDVPHGLSGSYINALDEKFQYAGNQPTNEPRWRVRNNLPGTADFCPLIAKTQKLDNYLKSNLSEQAENAIRDVPKDLLRRASAFLLLNDSKASFEIERERPSKDRAQRWAAMIGRAGETQLSISTLENMQRDLIEDDRFVKLGIRDEGGFVGEHTAFGDPRPDHISAKAEDLESLLTGLIFYDQISETCSYDPVLSSAALAFGFVYIHPFEDGNGRLHRYLIHHVLTAREYFPDEVIPPISVAILADLVSYRHALEAVSRPLLTVVDWKKTDKGNVQVLNDTIDFYRYFDATPHAEFLFGCLQRTIEKELPDELRFLSSRDDFHRDVTNLIDMPERTLDLLFHMLRQNDGQFSKRMLDREFANLHEDEAKGIEAIYNAATNH